jgi:hypothetical protein
MKIINNFNGLNIVLSEIVEDMKMEVLGIFTKFGKLDKIAPLSPGKTSSEWINSFLDITEAETEYPLIYSALRSFDEYTINVQGFIIHEVRDKLDSIDLMLNPDEVPPFPFGIKDKDKFADYIVDTLKGKAFDIKSKITDALLGLYAVPNKSMFAAITDLCDRLSFSYDHEKRTSVTDEWQYLYENYMRSIWKEEYDKQSGLKQIIGQWNDVIESLKAMNKPENFSI